MLSVLYKSLLATMFLSLSLPAPAEIQTGIDEDAQLPYWEYSDDAISMRLVQRLPIQSLKK